jgi:hypothetical protein
MGNSKIRQVVYFHAFIIANVIVRNVAVMNEIRNTYNHLRLKLSKMEATDQKIGQEAIFLAF